MAAHPFSRTIVSVTMAATASLFLSGCFDLLWFLGHEDPEIGQMQTDDMMSWYPNGTWVVWTEYVDGHTEYDEWNHRTGESGWISIAADGRVLGQRGVDPRTASSRAYSSNSVAPAAAANRPELTPSVPTPSAPRPAVSVPVPHVH